MSEGMVLKIVRVAMEVLSMRLLTILSMAMAAFFAVCVYLPCINIERGKKNDESKD